MFGWDAAVDHYFVQSEMVMTTAAIGEGGSTKTSASLAWTVRITASIGSQLPKHSKFVLFMRPRKSS